MFNGNNGPSLSDIAAVTGNDNNDSFMNGNGWWILIILFAIFGGWGNGAYNGSGHSTAATQADIQRGFDTSAVTNKLNGLENGLCDGFYAVNSSLLNGFNSVDKAILQSNCSLQEAINSNSVANMQNTFAIQQAINSDTIANMQNTNTLSSQIAGYNYDNKQGQTQITYDLATQSCALQNAIANQTQQIIQNDNNNYRALHEEIVNNRIEDLKTKIADQAQEISQLNLTASQSAQNQYLINQLRPAAVPSFTVPNPYSSYGYGCYCNGTNTTGCC